MEHNEDIATYRRSFYEREEKRQKEHDQRQAQAEQNIIQTVQSLAPQYPQLLRVYLFGSILSQVSFKPSSDIDLMVEGVSFEESFRLWKELEQKIPEHYVDVRVFEVDNPFCQRIKMKGKVIYERKDTNA